MVSELCVVVLRDESGENEHEFEATRHLFEASDRPTGKLGNCVDNGDTKNADMSPTLALSHNLAGVQPTSIARACRPTLDVALSPAERTHAAALMGELDVSFMKGKVGDGTEYFCWSSTRFLPRRTDAR